MNEIKSWKPKDWNPDLRDPVEITFEGIKSPEDSYYVYRKAHASNQAASEQLNRVKLEYAAVEDTHARLVAAHNARKTLGRLILHRDEGHDIRRTRKELVDLKAQKNQAGHDFGMANSYVWAVDRAANMHYHQNEAAYQQGALDGAAKEGIVINVGNTQVPKSPVQHQR
jgi:hypothetical protein